MTLVHRDRHVVDWPAFGWPDRWRRWFDFDDTQEWLRVEEFHDGEELVVRAELPDIDPEKDVEVTTSAGVVRIHAHRHQKAEHRDKAGYRTEFRYGEFDREIALPEGVSPEDIKATYTNGILEVRVPCPGHKEAVTKVPVTQNA